MKKIFYILASAIVALGAVACENEGMENIAPEVNGDTVSFVANIDNTKTDLEGLQTVWTAGDVITVVWNGTEYPFTNSEGALNVFSHTAEGLSAIQGATVEAWYNKAGVDSSKGTAGAQLYAKGSFGETLQFQIQSAFLKFTTKGTFKDPFVLTNGDFTWSKQEEGTYYIAVEANKTTILNYSIGGVTQKEAEITPVAGKIYKLGELTAEAFENWGVIGAHTGWDQENTQALYKVPASSGTYSRGNVTLADGGCLFLKQTVETEVIHHPEVTGGESGDWYLTPNSNWKESNARFAIYFFNNTSSIWVDMKDENGDGIYVADTPAGSWTTMIFCRMNPSNKTNSWDYRWNQSSDLTIPKNGNNHYTVKAGTWDKGGGTWAVHTPVEHKDAYDETVEKTVQVWANVNEDFKVGSWFTTYSNTSYNQNMVVTDYTKTYDLFIHTGEEQEWGYTIDVAIVEHNAENFDLKAFLGEY